MSVRKPFFILLGLLVAAGVGSYLTQQPTVFVYYRVIYLLLAVIVLGAFWAWFSLRGLTISRTARILRHQVGQVFEERFEVKNTTWIGRLWVEVKDITPIPGKQGSRVISNIGPRQGRSYFTRTLLSLRGAFRLGPTRLYSGDPFGLFSVSKEIEAEKTLLVLPFLVRLDVFPTPAGILPGGRALRRKSLEVTPYAAGVREYAPGDPLNRIHWRTTARKDRLMVKEFEQDPQADIWIMLDTQEGVHVSLPDNRRPEDRDLFWFVPHKLEIPLPPSTFEYAVSAAASIANYYITRGRSVGFSSAGRTLNNIPAERGERQLAKILETLAFVQADGQLSIIGLIEGQANQIPRGSTVVMVTTLITKEIELAVDIILRRDLKPIVVFIDSSSFGASWNSNGSSEHLKAYGIPVKMIRKDDNLQAALEG